MSYTDTKTFTKSELKELRDTIQAMKDSYDDQSTDFSIVAGFSAFFSVPGVIISAAALASVWGFSYMSRRFRTMINTINYGIEEIDDGTYDAITLEIEYRHAHDSDPWIPWSITQN